MSRITLPVLGLIVISLTSCIESEPPRPSKRHIVKDLVTSAAEDALCPAVTPKLLRAIAKVESSNRANVARFEKHHMKQISATWDNLVYSFENATSHGEFQILGKTARAYGVEPKEIREDRETSVRLAALHLGKCICGHERGDVRKGLMVYNAGPTFRKKGLGVISQASVYAEKVIRAMRG